MAEPVTIGMVLGILGAAVGVAIVGAIFIVILSLIAEGFKH